MFLFRPVATHSHRPGQHYRRNFLAACIIALSACATSPTVPTDPLQSSVATPVPTKPLASPIPAGSVVAITFTPGPAQGPAATKPSAPLFSTATAASTTDRNPIVTDNSTPLPTATETSTPGPTPTLGTPGTPDTRLTSTSVVATITALAASPTYPPTDRPRPVRRAPVVIGAAGDKVPPTTAPSQTGVTIQSLSERVFAGGTASLSIKTKPQGICELSMIQSSANGDVLQPIPAGATRTAGTDGVIAWIWSIESDIVAGPLRLVIDCGAAGVNQVQMLVGS